MKPLLVLLMAFAFINNHGQVPTKTAIETALRSGGIK